MGACAENILLEPVEQGLGGVWMGIYPDMERCRKMKKYFSLPEEIIPFAVIAAGYPAGENKPKDKYEPEHIHMGRY
ncbi:MAG: nitroreductase family protein [Lachnospiraceae bacterium]|nr:nitroreductase family protein [Lachnospiraceae bacterium]